MDVQDDQAQQAPKPRVCCCCIPIPILGVLLLAIVGYGVYWLVAR